MKRTSIVAIGALSAVLAFGGAGVASASEGSAGAVYTQTNGAGGNSILTFSRSSSGRLSPLGTYATGGLGTGSGLGSQGSVTLARDGALLLAVDAGSDDVASFAVRDDGSLTPVDRVASGGDQPISVTAHGGIAYVLNAGGSGNIAGFSLDGAGDLTPIAGSSRSLSTAASGPAELSFNPAGTALLVTEKNTNRLTTFKVGSDGLASAGTWISSAGVTPFGFAFDARGRAIVSEAWGGAADASTVSSYALRGGSATVIDGPVATTETSACWVAVTANGRFAYDANTGSGTVTGFAIGTDGSLTRLDANGVTGVTGGSPADLDASANGHFLYVRVGGLNDISAFRVAVDGSLSSIGTTGLPAGTVGIAAS
jgi:6-phosphogluconolactonase (cycloisomerase 2 family)